MQKNSKHIPILIFMSVKKNALHKGSPGLQAVVLSKVMVNNSNQKFLFLIFILMKLGEFVVPIRLIQINQVSKSRIKIKKVLKKVIWLVFWHLIWQSCRTELLLLKCKIVTWKVDLYILFYHWFHFRIFFLHKSNFFSTRIVQKITIPTLC